MGRAAGAGSRHILAAAEVRLVIHLSASTVMVLKHSSRTHSHSAVLQGIPEEADRSILVVVVGHRNRTGLEGEEPRSRAADPAQETTT